MNELRLCDIEVDDLKQYLEGRWINVFDALGNKALRDATSRWQSNSRRKAHGECPVHGGKNQDGFRLFEQGAKNGGADLTGGGICNSCGGFRDGFKLLMASNGWDFRTTLLEVAIASGYNPSVTYQPVVQRGPTPHEVKLQKEEDDRKRWKMRKLYQQSKPLHNRGNHAVVLVRRYLNNRGITDIPETFDLRAHPGLYYRPKDGEPAAHAGKYPAMLAVVRAADGTAVSLHRTWLTPEATKAKVAQPRREIARPSYFSTVGAAIRLGNPNTVLGVAEGIETALSVHQATEIPVWSTLNATLMASLGVPESVKRVVIFADKDSSFGGQRGAAELVKKMLLEGRDVLVCMPEAPIPTGAKGIDWNDVLRDRGAAGFGHLRILGGSSDSSRNPLTAIA